MTTHEPHCAYRRFCRFVHIGGRRKSAKRGAQGTGVTPYGYVRGDDGLLVVDPEAKAHVKFAYSRIIAGDSIEDATRALNAHWPTYEGKRGGRGFIRSTVEMAERSGLPGSGRRYAVDRIG